MVMILTVKVQQIVLKLWQRCRELPSHYLFWCAYAPAPWQTHTDINTQDKHNTLKVWKPVPPCLEQTVKQSHYIYSIPLLFFDFDVPALSLYTSLISSHFLSVSLSLSSILRQLHICLLLPSYLTPLSLSLSLQAQDFYVEMKWEFTSWGDLSVFIIPVCRAAQFQSFRANHLIISLWGWWGLLLPLVMDTDAHTLSVVLNADKPGFGLGVK